MTETERLTMLLAILERQNEAQLALLEMLESGRNRHDMRKTSSLLSHNKNDIRKLRLDQQEREIENEII